MLDQTSTETSATRPCAAIAIILTQPKQPGNIGAAARAMKTMGLERLVLVAPPDDVRSHSEALRMAHGAHDLLTAARVVTSLAEALAGTRLAIATTHRRRAGRPRALTPAEAAERLVAALSAPAGPAVRTPKRGPARADADAAHVALVFGREDRGLTTAELDLCAHTTRIPAVTRHPSLNLAQAVMVYGWEIRRATLAGAPSAPRSVSASAPFEEVDALFDELDRRLSERPMTAATRDTLLRTLRRFLARSAPTSRELAALRRLVRGLDASG